MGVGCFDYWLLIAMFLCVLLCVAVMAGFGRLVLWFGLVWFYFTSACCCLFGVVAFGWFGYCLMCLMLDNLLVVYFSSFDCGGAEFWLVGVLVACDLCSFARFVWVL